MGECAICGFNTLFFTWTSSRNFPLNRAYNIFPILKILHEKENGIKICYSCRKIIEINEEI